MNKELDLDFLKWAIDLADGFSVKIANLMEGLFFNGRYLYAFYQDVVFDDETETYPLLLQRAIEGVNRKDGEVFIIQNHIGIEVVDWLDYETQKGFIDADVDQAKEAALRWVWEYK